MGTQSEYEIWKSEGSGVLTETPLIMAACKGGQIGSVFSYDGGKIYKTVFTYLCGAPDKDIVNKTPELIYENRLVCMSDEWEEFIRSMPVKFILRREVMEPFCSQSSKKIRPLPAGYTLTTFTPEIFDTHPFDHGRNYRDFKDFEDRGAGAAVLFEGKVVSASSSFLSYEGHVELDVFTEPDHRNKGLADHAVYEMLNQSYAKGLTVHWDAQNPMSSGMAVSHGLTPVSEYAVYWLAENKN